MLVRQRFEPTNKSTYTIKKENLPKQKLKAKISLLLKGLYAKYECLIGGDGDDSRRIGITSEEVF